MFYKLLVYVFIVSLIIYIVFNFPYWILISIENAYSKSYEENIYDCDDFSKDLVIKLNSFGYNSKIEYSSDFKKGYCGDYKSLYENILDRNIFCHAWVLLTFDDMVINIESTNGFFYIK